MSDNPVFVYAAVYADRADADADYDTLLDAHAAELVGSYDVALMYKDDEGKLTYEAVAEAHGLGYSSLDEVLPLEAV